MSVVTHVAACFPRTHCRHGSQITDHRSRLRGKMTDPELKSSDVICTCPKRLSSNVSRIHAGSILRMVRSGPGSDFVAGIRQRGSEAGSKTGTRVTSRRQPGETKATSAPSTPAACSLLSCAGSDSRTSSQAVGRLSTVVITSAPASVALAVTVATSSGMPVEGQGMGIGVVGTLSTR